MRMKKIFEIIKRFWIVLTFISLWISVGLLLRHYVIVTLRWEIIYTPVLVFVYAGIIFIICSLLKMSKEAD